MGCQNILNMKNAFLITISFFIFNCSNAQVSFNSPNYYSLGNSSTAIAIADFNNDGNMDVAAALYSTNHLVGILLGNGNGQLSSATYIPATSQTQIKSIISADFNGDTKIDLAIADYTGNSIYILLGDGTGGFGTPATYSTAQGPRSIVSADFNGDNKLDLAVTCFVNKRVSILLGDGLGGFGFATNIVVGVSPISMTNADYNGDGKMDLAIADSYINEIYLMQGDGLGGFTVLSPIATAGTNPNSIISAFLNADTKPDLIVACYNSGTVVMPSFGNFNFQLNVPLLDMGQFITSGDFDNDGKVDLASSDLNGKRIMVKIGNGISQFPSGIDINLATNPAQLLSADFNNDGKQDIVFSSGNVGILLNTSVPNSVNNVSLSSSISISPNPSCNKFSIVLPEIPNLRIEIYNCLGELIYKMNQARVSNIVDMTNTTQGLYIVKIKKDEMLLHVEKVLLNH